MLIGMPFRTTRKYVKSIPNGTMDADTLLCRLMWRHCSRSRSIFICIAVNHKQTSLCGLSGRVEREKDNKLNACTIEWASMALNI